MAQARWVAAAFAVGSLMLAATGAARAQAPAAPLELRGAGSSFAAPLYKRWGEAYGKENPGIAVAYESVGSGEGIRRFVAGALDFGASDRPLTDAEIAKVERGAVLVPVTAGMVAIAYSLPGVTGELKLPRDVYVDIFAGKITSWSDPRIQQANPGLALPKRSIGLVVRMDGSGTTHAFTSHLAAVSPAWKDTGPGVGTLVGWPSRAQLGRGNEGVAHAIKISDGAIGYVEYGFAKRLGLSLASLGNKAGRFVKPSEPSAQRALAEALKDPRLAVTDPADAEAYPIVTFTWLMLYQTHADATKAAALKAFLSWGLNPAAQKIGEGLGYVPLPESVAAHGRSLVAGLYN